MRNSVRFDLSDYLIHFFRRVDISSDTAPVLTPESMGFANLHEDAEWSAVFMLRCAIRHQHLWSTWSYRGGVRTIYGRSPAVCFTEMPLAAFLDAGQAREARGEAMSAYAFVFPKSAMYALGANPVIYGLDRRNALSVKVGEARVFPSDVLPEHEQYRYVTYSPLLPRPVDWTHEREWRWPFRSDMAAFEQELETYGVVDDPKDIPGLRLNQVSLAGMGVVVKTREEAGWVAADILTLVDRGLIQQDHYRFILVGDELEPGNLRHPADLQLALEAAAVDLEPFFSLNHAETSRLDARFSQLAQKVADEHSTEEPGEHGGVWFWLLDDSNRLTRALLASGRVSVSTDGRYLASLPEFGRTRGMVQRQTMVQALAKRVHDEFDTDADYFAVSNAWDFDEVPTYAGGDAIANRFVYNVAW